MSADSSFRIEAKNHDYDRYLCSLFAKNSQRADAWVVIAFAAELARIVAIASEGTVAAIRLKWWQEALADLPNLPAGQASPPLLLALQGVMSRHTIPSGLIDQMISARMMEVEYPQGFDNLAMFERYINGTAGALHEWLAWMIAPEKMQTMRGIIYESAHIYAVIGLLRALPFHVHDNIVRWPVSMLHDYQLSLTPAEIHSLDMKRFIEHWLNDIKRKQLTDQKAFAALPKLHRKLHALSHYYAKELWQHRADITHMPRQLGLMPWRLMLAS